MMQLAKRLALAGVVLILLMVSVPQRATAQVYTTYRPVVRGWLFPRVVYRPTATYAVAAPVTSYYAPAPVTSYYAPAPVTTYYAPSAPVTTSYYAPAPVTSYYAPAPVTTYYAPARRVRAYYAPTYYYGF